MTNRLNVLKARLAVARVDHRQRKKEYNAAHRAFMRSVNTLVKLEKQIEAYLAKSK